jgi:hypothetical protein
MVVKPSHSMSIRPCPNINKAKPADIGNEMMDIALKDMGSSLGIGGENLRSLAKHCPQPILRLCAAA